MDYELWGPDGPRGLWWCWVFCWSRSVCWTLKGRRKIHPYLNLLFCVRRQSQRFRRFLPKDNFYELVSFPLPTLSLHVGSFDRIKYVDQRQKHFICSCNSVSQLVWPVITKTWKHLFWRSDGILVPHQLQLQLKKRSHTLKSSWSRIKIGFLAFCRFDVHQYIKLHISFLRFF